MSRRRKKTFEFVDEVPEKCFCITCRGVHTDILQLRNCEHSICESCFSRRLKNNLKFCPCSAPLEEGSEEATLKLRYLLEDLNVRCPKHCGEVVRLKETGTHAQNECPLAMVKCENKGCHRKMKRKELGAHMKLCDFRIVSCEGCERHLKFIELRKHQISNGCINQKLKQVVVRQLRGSDKELKQYISTIRQETFKSMRDERSLEKEYMWKRIERNPDRFSPTLVRNCVSENRFNQDKIAINGFSSSASNKVSDGTFSRESPLLLRSRERKIRSAEPQICKRCQKMYTSRSNHDEACLWHKGVSFLEFHTTGVTVYWQTGLVLH